LNSPKEILESVFGYLEFRPHQEEVISRLLQGKDTFVLMPTGGGKSLCYQVPALMLKGTAIIVSPLIALMKDQVDALCANGVRAAFYNSALEGAEARRVLAQLHAGELDLLYVAPERLASDSFVERLKSIKISMFAIDEAHCVSQWGHDFRPDYVKLGVVREQFSGVPFMALTATADSQTRSDVVHQLRLRDPEIVVAGFDRPNINYRVFEKHNPLRQVIEVLERQAGESGIIYALSRKRVEDIASKLAKAGHKAAPYHAGLSSAIRSDVHEKFVRDEIDVVVATVAFGMGIDKPDIRFVIHYDIPKSIEAYYQETGRGGRDGLPCEALMLLGYQDVITARALVENTADQEQKQIDVHKLNAMVGFAECLSCRRQVLLGYFGERLDKSCGNCDLCESPPECFDGTLAAQKALSCVYRVGQNFGMRHIVDVLRGLNHEKMHRFRHQNLSTWGVGKEYSEHEWMSFIRQLIHKGHLFQDLGNYAVLRLNENSHRLLKGELTVDLAKPRAIVRKSKQKKKAAQVVADLCDTDQLLFAALRDIRTDLARSQNVPPYVVFGDKTLKQMAFEKPKDSDGFLELNGVGASKLEKYGAIFLAAIATFEQGQPSISSD
jgi:ATP-dependent DNA helicase RecQ